MTKPELPTKADFPVHRRHQTRWADNDVYGHVNNVVYYAWFDTAVNGWLMEAAGCDIRDLPAIGVVAETSCKYLAEVSFPDELSIGLAVEHSGRSSVIYKLAVFKVVDGVVEDTPRALGRFVHVYVDSDARTPVPIPEQVATALEQLR
ncbi:acyl-CoA thioesterase [Mycobacteroides abscessus]|uniref:acyl-CoA thioesterase n=1 Tax=Mycobacteroides abscessus TaxID=36809 RepID=UPI000C25CA32|nr:thioesterase family protein [Mycobacteroides abscessus]